MREIKFRAFMQDDLVDDNPKMVYDIAFEEYAPINDLLNAVPNIMQFTGLKDKNGKEIYEGDIMKGTHSIPLTVSFEDGKFCFINNLNSGVDMLSQMRCEKLEIIGNIYEHSHLMKILN